MMAENLTTADVLALNRQSDDDGDGMFGGGFMWVFFLFFLLAWGGGGFGIGNNANGVLTRADLSQDMNFQELSNSVRSVQSGLCDGFYAMNTGMLNGFSGVQRDLCTGFSTVSQGFNDVNSNINQARFDMQHGFCETNHSISDLRYENARNTCDIVNAIREDGALTRAQMTQTEIQNLRDNLQSAKFQLSQQAQNSYLINELKPCPVPAYLTASPYAAYNLYEGYSYGGCGCGYANQ
jgi:hypothetical protein